MMYRVNFRATGTCIYVYIQQDGFTPWVFCTVHPPTLVEKLVGITYENKVLSALKRAHKECDKFISDNRLSHELVKKLKDEGA